ncbi:MAG: hypothetical protein NC039_06570 [Muribaculaceae bacterium]|nr:hypothetical protein [Muribaculaceae bacterium]
MKISVIRLTLLTLLTVVCAGMSPAQSSKPAPSIPDGVPEDIDSVTTVTTVTTVTRTTWYRSRRDSVSLVDTVRAVRPSTPLRTEVEAPYVVPDVAPLPSAHYIDTINGYPVNEDGKIVIATIDPKLLQERVVVGSDTVPIILHAPNYGRYDRGLFNFLFIPRGQWLFGLTASYGEFNSDDVQILSLIKDFNFKGKMYSVSPTFGYFFRNNQAVGMKFVYSRGIADLGGLAVDFDDDINFTLSDISYYSQMYTASVFYRNYVGLGTEKRFAIFNEIDLAFGSGSSRFKRSYDGDVRDTKTLTSKWSLNFSPGVTMFLMDNVCFNVSFGVFGIHYTHDRQYTNGIDEGSRISSGANFKFNIFNINFGLGVCI